ncbi:MAG: hypothetical protein KatS3mg013_1515 [Actinomycetota bacterium]|jgi:protein phosphatase|nr:MAG: hypothetical protein KatS3mg013_1515 [Actinomycetota bacterium]
MKVAVGVATDVGLVRSGNEDAFLVEPPLFAVADGMGGHRGGEVASRLALETLDALQRRGVGTLADRVREANRVVFERSVRDRRVAGMGTTLTAAEIEGGTARLVHVGDSRAYLLRAGAMRRLTRDHTLVDQMVRAGEITEAEAEVHPHRNVLTRAVGTEPDVAVDETELGLLDGDRLLLCSDGLTGMVPEVQIRAILEATPDPQEAADRLVHAANRAGGLDNTTVVVIDVRGVDDPPAPSGPAAGSTTAGPGVVRGVGLRRAVLAATIVLVALGGVGALARAWIEDRWYVGVADGQVAIYRGIPAEVLGFRLSRVEVRTDISADAAQALPQYAGLSEGINQDDRAAAEALVERIDEDLRVRAGQGDATPEGG